MGLGCPFGEHQVLLREAVFHYRGEERVEPAVADRLWWRDRERDPYCPMLSSEVVGDLDQLPEGLVERVTGNQTLDEPPRLSGAAHIRRSKG